MARNRYAENKAMAQAWQEATERDGDCRLRFVPDFGPCSGPGEFAHVGKYRRFLTRGKPADQRHHRRFGIKMCSGHHRTGRYAYDLNRMNIEPLDDDRYCDGPLRFTAGDKTYEEPE